MAYYLTIEEKKGQYKELILDDLEDKGLFLKDSNRKLKRDGAYTLREIDIFTTQFNDLEELKSTLVHYGIIDISLINKKLSIRYNNAGKFKKLKYDPLFQEDIEMMLEPMNIITLINKKIYYCEYEFVIKFFERIRNDNKNVSSIDTILNILNVAKSSEEGRVVYHTEGVEYLLNSKIIERTINYILYGKDNKLKDRKLHDMITTLKNIESNNERVNDNINEMNEEPEMDDSIDPDTYMFDIWDLESEGKIIKPIIDTKKESNKKRGKKKEIDGQITLF